MNLQRNKTRSKGSSLPRMRPSPLAACMLLLVVTLAGWAATSKLCFTQLNSGPPNFGAPPLIDGTINNGDPRWSGPDFGWSGAFRYVFGNVDGPVLPDAMVQGITDGNKLYIYVEANNTTPTGGSPDPMNAVAIAFDPDKTGTKMQWLIIKPVLNGAINGTKRNVQDVEYYWDQNSTSSVNFTNNVDNPSWLNGAGPTSNNAPCATAGTVCIQTDDEGATWSMEMALPIVGQPSDLNFATEQQNGLTLPNKGEFRMYINVLRVVSGQWAQSTWPVATAIVGCPIGSCPVNGQQLDTSLPDPSNWGNSTIDPNPIPACNGIYIGSQNLDISVTNPKFPTTGTNNQIDATDFNTFHAKVHNTGAAANNVVVTFSIANFGLPSSSSWQQVAVSQPASGSPIPSTGTTLDSSTWKPPNPNDYDPNVPGSHPHQCMLASLSTNPPNDTFFTMNSAVQNMDFFHASKVERKVQVSSKDYPDNPQHPGKQEFDLFVQTKEDVLTSCPDRPMAAGVANQSTQTTHDQVATTNCTKISRLIETVEACRHTGRFLADRNKHQMELCEPVGSFGFVAQHPGANTSWNFHLTGAGIGKPDSKGVYHLQMPNNQTVDLAATVDTGACSVLPGFGGGAVFILGGVFLIGLVVYRPRRKKKNASEESPIQQAE